MKNNADRRKKLDAGEEVIIPVVKEVVKVDKHKRETGITRIKKTVHNRVEVIDEPIEEDEVQVERVAVNRFVEKPVPVRHENGTTIVPLLKEVVVTEKRLLLKEELHIRKLVKKVRKPLKVILREEEAAVEHITREDHSRK